MDALMDLLAKKPEPAKSDETGEGENAAGDLMSPSFVAASSQAMDAVKAGDSAAFADALKACIEMAGG